MIEPTKETCLRIHEIYSNVLKAIDSSGVHINYDPIDIIDMGRLISTYYVKMHTMKYNIIYWKFLDAWLEYMKTGVWYSLPYMWQQTIDASKNIDNLPEYRIEDEYELYLRKREAVCRGLGLCHLPESDNLVKLHWLQRKDGEQSFLQVPHLLAKSFLYHTGLQIEGTINQGRVRDDHLARNPSFNNANQNAWPTVGETKMQVIQNKLNEKTK